MAAFDPGRANRDDLPPAATSLVRLDIALPTMETATPIEVEVTVANQRAKGMEAYSGYRCLERSALPA